MITDMTTGSPLRRILTFVAPMLLGQVLSMLHVFVDATVLGRLVGFDAFAAVGASGYLYWVVSCLSSGMAGGIGSVFARRFGAGNRPGLRAAIAMAYALAALLGGALSIGGACGAGPLLRLLDTPADIYPMAADYLRVRFSFLWLGFFANVTRRLCYALGDSRTPLLSNALAVALNLVLNIALVLLTSLGAVGVALATAIAELVGTLLCLGRLRRADVLPRTRAHWRYDAAALREHLRVGIPLSLRDLPSATLALVVQQQINLYGTAYVAGVAAAKQLYVVLFSAGEAIAAANGMFVGQNTGAGLYGRVTRGMRVSRLASLGGAAALAGIVWLLRAPLLGLFIAGEGAQVALGMQVALAQLALMLVCLPAYYMTMLYREALGGLGNGVGPMVSGLLEAGTRVASVLLLPGLIGATGLYISEVVGWPVMMVQLAICYSLLLRKQGRAVSTAPSSGKAPPAGR